MFCTVPIRRLDRRGSNTWFRGTALSGLLTVMAGEELLHEMRRMGLSRAKLVPGLEKMSLAESKAGQGKNPAG